MVEAPATEAAAEAVPKDEASAKVETQPIETTTEVVPQVKAAADSMPIEAVAMPKDLVAVKAEPVAAATEAKPDVEAPTPNPVPISTAAEIMAATEVLPKEANAVLEMDERSLPANSSRKPPPVSLQVFKRANSKFVQPMHDVKLSKLLTRLLRHKAKELGVAIDSKGWVALPDAIEQINGTTLRDMLDFTEELGSQVYSEAEVRTVVRLDDKLRFELWDAVDGAKIRNVQGHTMKSIATDIGTLLTEANAPSVALHGTYSEHLHDILRDGLARGKRNHIHLAKGLYGEAHVRSGMRRDVEVVIWVDVRKAIRAGYVFYESQNGVILCAGRSNATADKDGNLNEEDGILPPKYFSVVIELNNGLVLLPAQVRLLERLFTGCSRISVSKMHGGFSGSLVLRVESWDENGQPGEPTVAKLDDGASLVLEVKQTRFMADFIGDLAIKVMRGPVFLGPDGEEKEASGLILDKIHAEIERPLFDRLKDGTIRLLRCSWLMSPEADAMLGLDPDTNSPILLRRQDMPNEAYASPAEAAEQLSRGDRSVLSITHCWCARLPLHALPSLASCLGSPCAKAQRPRAI